MRFHLFILIFLFYGISCNAQNNINAIKISQSLRGGDGNNALVLGYDEITVKQIVSKSTAGPIDTRSILVDKKTINFLSNKILEHCNRENPLRKNTDG